jgi:hypothetical protein
MQALWEHKTIPAKMILLEEFYDRAGIWAEFGKIVCISVGYFTIKGDIRNFRVSFGRKILSDFNNLLNNHFNQPQHVLCGHNVLTFSPGE